MKVTKIRVSYSCKFNDPQKRCMNHNVNAEAEVEIQPGEDMETVRLALYHDLEGFVHGRRAQLYKAAELENEFASVKRDFDYAVRNIRDYEEGSKRATQKMTEANKLFEKLSQMSRDLGKLGVTVELPKGYIDLPGAKPALAVKPLQEDEQEDPDDTADEEAGID